MTTRRSLAELTGCASGPVPSPLERANRNITLRQQEADDLRQRCREAGEDLIALRKRAAGADRRVDEARQEFYAELERRRAESDRREAESVQRHEERMRQIEERSVTYVADHIAIVRLIPPREALDVILDGRDDITSWTILVDWVKAGGPGQEDGDPDASEISRRRRNQGGLQLQVPATVIKGLADLGANPREAMAMFWQNVSPMLIISVAYPDRVPASATS